MDENRNRAHQGKAAQVKRDRIFAYVPHGMIEEHARAGWVHVPALEGCHHGEWSVLMEWKCETEPPNMKRHSSSTSEDSLRKAWRNSLSATAATDAPSIG